MKAYGYKGYRTRLSGLQKWLQGKGFVHYCANKEEYYKRTNDLIVPYLESKEAKVYTKGQSFSKFELNAKFVCANFSDFAKFILSNKDSITPVTKSHYQAYINQ